MVRTLSVGVVEDTDKSTEEGEGKKKYVAWEGDGNEVLCHDEGCCLVTRPLGPRYIAGDSQPYAALFRPQREKNLSGVGAAEGELCTWEGAHCQAVVYPSCVHWRLPPRRLRPRSRTLPSTVGSSWYSLVTRSNTTVANTLAYSLSVYASAVLGTVRPLPVLTERKCPDFRPVMMKHQRRNTRMLLKK